MTRPLVSDCAARIALVVALVLLASGLASLCVGEREPASETYRGSPRAMGTVARGPVEGPPGQRVEGEPGDTTPAFDEARSTAPHPRVLEAAPRPLAESSAYEPATATAAVTEAAQTPTRAPTAVREADSTSSTPPPPPARTGGW